MVELHYANQPPRSSYQFTQAGEIIAIINHANCLGSVIKIFQPYRLSGCEKLTGLYKARGYAKAANTIDRLQSDIRNSESFPKEHWKRIRTTNGVERINKELKRRTKVVRAFPNEDSLMRLTGSILIDINEEWVTGPRYLSMEKE